MGVHAFLKERGLKQLLQEVLNNLVEKKEKAEVAQNKDKIKFYDKRVKIIHRALKDLG